MLPQPQNDPQKRFLPGVSPSWMRMITDVTSTPHHPYQPSVASRSRTCVNFEKWFDGGVEQKRGVLEQATLTMPARRRAIRTAFLYRFRVGWFKPWCFVQRQRAHSFLSDSLSSGRSASGPMSMNLLMLGNHVHKTGCRRAPMTACTVPKRRG